MGLGDKVMVCPDCGSDISIRMWNFVSVKKEGVFKSGYYCRKCDDVYSKEEKEFNISHQAD